MRFNLEQNTSQDLAASFAKIELLRAEFERQREELNNVFKTELSTIFQSFFQQITKIKSVAWTQYTPYFCDGDACTFSLNTIYFSTTDGSDFSGYYDEDNSDGDFSGELYSIKTHLTAEELSLCEQLECMLSKNQEFLEGIFGDHVQVVANKDGITESEHEHD